MAISVNGTHDCDAKASRTIKQGSHDCACDGGCTGACSGSDE